MHAYIKHNYVTNYNKQGKYLYKLYPSHCDLEMYYVGTLMTDLLLSKRIPFQ